MSRARNEALVARLKVRQDVRSVLTPAQKTKVDNMRRALRGRMGAARAGRMGKGGMRQGGGRMGPGMMPGMMPGAPQGGPQGAMPRMRRGGDTGPLPVPPAN
jgi:hypothetical protein